GEGRFRSEKRDCHRFFERQLDRHDLAIDRAERLVSNRSFVELRCALQHSQLPMRRVNLLTMLELKAADFKHMTGPVIEQPDNLLVEIIDGFSVLGNVHEGWMGSGAGASALSADGEVSAGTSCSGGA